jgi:glutathione S-transferase
MHLYHLPRSRSSRVLWALEEIGEPFELTVLTRDDRASDAHRARHPLGRVPAIEDDEGFLFESAAICLQLADVYPGTQLNWPLATHERGLVYQWTVFAMTELEPAVVEVRRHRDGDAALVEGAAARFAAAAGAVQQALTDQEYLVGDRFSIADLVCGAVLIFGQSSGLTGELANVEAYIARLEQRPARQRALAVGT